MNDFKATFKGGSAVDMIADLAKALADGGEVTLEFELDSAGRHANVRVNGYRFCSTVEIAQSDI